MRKHQVGKNGPVETDCATLNVSAWIFLKSAMGEARAKEFVLAEQDEENCRGHAHDGNGFEKGCGGCRHSSRLNFLTD